MAKIVVLDDVFECSELLKTRLILDGHEVRTVSAAADAIDLAYLFQPDLLIMDWNLDSDGYCGMEVAEAFHAANIDIKTIIITAASTEKEFQRLRESDQDNDHGLIASFLKPVSVQQLAQAVKNAMQVPLQIG